MDKRKWFGSGRCVALAAMGFWFGGWSLDMVCELGCVRSSWGIDREAQRGAEEIMNWKFTIDEPPVIIGDPLH